eukprot:jgi/Bigna1/88617/estExt_fgenesh1_pg.C_350022
MDALMEFDSETFKSTSRPMLDLGFEVPSSSTKGIKGNDDILLSPFERGGSGLNNSWSNMFNEYSNPFSEIGKTSSLSNDAGLSKHPILGSPKLDMAKVFLAEDSSSGSVDEKKIAPDKKKEEDEPLEIRYKNLRYIGPTKKNRPNYKSKQKWEWDIYPHGISMQNGKLRVQIKQKGVNPTYPHFPNTFQGLLDAAIFRDEETQRLWDAGILVRAPKFNFDHGPVSKRHQSPSTELLSSSSIQNKKRKMSQILPPPSPPQIDSPTLNIFKSSDEDLFPFIMSKHFPMTPTEELPKGSNKDDNEWEFDDLSMEGFFQL